MLLAAAAHIMCIAGESGGAPKSSRKEARGNGMRAGVGCSPQRYYGYLYIWVRDGGEADRGSYCGADGVGPPSSSLCRCVPHTCHVRNGAPVSPPAASSVACGVGAAAFTSASDPDAAERRRSGARLPNNGSLRKDGTDADRGGSIMENEATRGRG